MNLQELKETWKDEPDYHQTIHESFTDILNITPELKAHRDFVQNNIYGFGERSFWWLWKLLCDELAVDSKLLEVGCFKGATLSVWKLLLPDSKVFGVTPLDSTGIDWEGDYAKFIADIHEKFGQQQPTIIKGLSEAPESIQAAKEQAPYDVTYIDGGHERHHIDNDLLHYAPMVKPGGYLVIDDAACWMNMPFGYFQGILPVSEGLVDYMKEHGSEWEFITNCVHLMVYKKK